MSVSTHPRWQPAARALCLVIAGAMLAVAVQTPVSVVADEPSPGRARTSNAPPTVTTDLTLTTAGA